MSPATLVHDQLTQLALHEATSCYVGSSMEEGRHRTAEEQRAANAAARDAGVALPYPNIWDVLDPTKVSPDATPEQLRASYEAFRHICRARPCRRHTL